MYINYDNFMEYNDGKIKFIDQEHAGLALDDVDDPKFLDRILCDDMPKVIYDAVRSAAHTLKLIEEHDSTLL